MHALRFLSVLIGALAEVIGGIVSGSLALITDALHNFSDVVSLVVSYAAIKVSKRPKSLDFTFGWKRAQILAAVMEDMPLSPATEILAGIEKLLAEDFGFNHSVLQMEIERGHDGRLVSS